ncbi:MAG: hypothetical protein H7Y86_14335 [Rhizobacter sp.]|nr:hypothetical protein [Ferruginibacter sp.]
MRSAIFLTTVIFSFLSNRGYTQGCSDAGFCTIGNLGQQSDASAAKQKISILLPFGLGDEDVLVFNPAIQYDNQLSKTWAVQAKITASYANGNLGNAGGPGDIFLSGTYFFPSQKNRWQVSATVGTKLPLNESHLKEKGLSLPMQYQSSLGTFDLVTGIAFTNKKWQLAAGWQQPLSGTNGNQFLPVYWAGNSDASRYIPSNDFKRKAELLFRSLYKYKPNQRFSFNGGLLGIFHLGKDTYIDANLSNKPIAISGSEGLTLNATLAGWYNISKKLQLGLQAGVPIVVRDKRPDGLTRSFVVSPEVSWNF